MMFDPFPVFLPAEYRVKFATETWEHREAAALRRQLFCEQGIFSGDDRDAIDNLAITIVAISSFCVVPHEVVGTVRIHEAEPGTWWGARLAVASGYHRIGETKQPPSTAATSRAGPVDADRRLPPLRRVPRRLGRGTSLGEHEIQEHREIRSDNQHRVLEAAQQAPRRHRAAARLQIGEQHPHAGLEHLVAEQLLDVFDAERLNGQRHQLRPASCDLLYGRDKTRAEIGVAGHDRPRAR